MSSPAIFKRHLFEPEAGIVDPYGVHHEFSQGLHGQKADFDAIPNDSVLMDEWVENTVRAIVSKYPRLPQVILSVAKGTDRLVGPVAERLGNGVIAAKTVKVSPTQVALTPEAEKVISKLKPEFVLVKEDVGTTGGNSLTAALAAMEAGAKYASVLTTLGRKSILPMLEQADIDYDFIVQKNMPDYTPRQCELVGPCAQGWRLIPYGSENG